MLNPRGEKFVTRMLMCGIAAILGGGIVFAMLFVGGLARMANTQGGDVGEVLVASLALLVVVAGIVMIIVGLVTGLKLSSGKTKEGAKHVPEVVIASRFAINAVGEMIFSNFEFDAPGGKLYVQMKFPDGHVEELKTAWGVFCQCGEGMRGAALIKGSWLASFAPIIERGEPLRNPEL